MLRRKSWKMVILFALPFLLNLMGCSTSIPLQVQRPPRLNTSGIKRVAIMPFDGSRREADAARHATTVARRNISSMNHFTLVSNDEVERLRRSGQNIESYVDATFVGKINRVSAEHGSFTRTSKNRDGVSVTVTYYTTEVEVDLEYQFERARDASIIGPVIRSGRASNTITGGRYPDTAPLIAQAVERALGSVGRDVAPHTVTERRTFATEKNSALKEPMKNALALVKSGSNKAALQAYLKIYEDYQSVAAAQNAAILHEMFGETEAAAQLMQEVFESTGNFQAKAVYDRLNKILQDQETITSEYSAEARQNPAVRVAAAASEEIQRVLPEGAVVWFYNNASRNEIVEAVSDNLTSEFIKKGIRIVDRENSDLIQAEQDFHMSGAVSDDDITRVGEAAGANTIIILGISGSGAMRRLQVRVLDIERSVPIMQSDTSEKWQL